LKFCPAIRANATEQSNLDITSIARNATQNINAAVNLLTARLEEVIKSAPALIASSPADQASKAARDNNTMMTLRNLT
jgi:hypothetical protein